MRKIISFAAAIAVAAASFSTIASAEPLVELDIKTKWSGEDVFSDHPTESPKRLLVGTSEQFASEARLSMAKVADKWYELLEDPKAKRFIDSHGGGEDGLDELLKFVTLTGEYTLKITASDVITNADRDTVEDNKNIVLNWQNNHDYSVNDFFVQKDQIHAGTEPGTWEVTMKVKDGLDQDAKYELNKKFNQYYNDIKNATNKSDYDFILDINDSNIATGSVGSYSVSGTFSGYVQIEAKSLVYNYENRVDFDPTSDTEYIVVETPAPTYRPISGGGGGGHHAIPTAAPAATSTPKPFSAETVEPLSDTINDGYDSEETIRELGDIIGFVVEVKNSDGTDGVYNEDYTITDKDGHVLTPAEVNALQSNPNVVLSDYYVNLAAGATAVTKALYKSGAQIDYNNHFAYIIGYPEGDVRPENNISRAEVATIFFRLLTDDSRAEYWSTTNSFSDVKSADWYNNAISTVANAGIVRGYEDGSFRPDAPITRAEFATIASRFAAATGVIAADFSDISGHWSADNVKKAASVGWVTGYEDGTFRPDNNITRAEAMTIVNRVTFRLVDSNGLHSDAIKWIDNPESAWYYAIVEEATNSHKYTRGTIGDNESWTEVTEHRDWSKLEKETSDKAAIIVGIENGALTYENNDGNIITEEK